MAKHQSELSRAFSEDGALKTHVGGQALLGGIMMRGMFNWAVAVREPEGSLYVEEHDLASGRQKNKWMQWPFIRGCTALVESLVLGYRALEIAAIHTAADKDEKPQDKDPKSDPDGFPDPAASARDASAQRSISFDTSQQSSYTDGPSTFSWKEDFGRPDTMIDALGAQRSLEVKTDKEIAPTFAQGAAPKDSGQSEGFGKKEMTISMVLGLVLGIVLFIVVPAGVTNVLVGEYDDRTLLWNIVDGVLRVCVFVFYIWLIGRLSDVREMFAYHGAEHKTIHCYEHGLPLTPENAQSFPRLHVRCGTAFLIMVMIIAILVYTVLPINSLIAATGVPDGVSKLVLVIAVRIIFLPVIAGISYEITVKWAGSHPDNPLVKVILWPGMQMQYLTTKDPDDSMIEAAIAAMSAVLKREEKQAAASAEASGISSHI